MTPTIRFVVISVARRNTSGTSTIHFTYAENGSQKGNRTPGAVWEEIDFMIEEEEKPVIQVGNVSGNAILNGSSSRLIINNPDLFGTFKVGDTIDFMPALKTSSN